MLGCLRSTMRMCFFSLRVFCNHFCHLKEISFKWINGDLFLVFLNIFNDLISIIWGSWDEHGNRYRYWHPQGNWCVLGVEVEGHWHKHWYRNRYHNDLGLSRFFSFCLAFFVLCVRFARGGLSLGDWLAQ